jgi:NAD(P)-dependent dehydrogenase (short-subunit alcohol dehydrogenase family)
MKAALLTGASLGLGRAVALALAQAGGWKLIVNARGSAGLSQLLDRMPDRDNVTLVVGDVRDPAHRAALVAAADRLGRLDLLVNNASTLGPTPLSPLRTTDLGRLADVFEINVIAPAELSKALLPLLSASHGAVVNMSSDAGVEHYETWGVYGASKAALDHLTLTYAAENPEIHWYAVDPGDMRTRLQQEAFPGEDISDRLEPEAVAPAILEIVADRPPSGRYRAADVRTPSGSAR